MSPSAAPDPSNPAATEESPELRRSRLRLGGFLVGIGVLHVVVPKPFEAIIPDALGHKRELNLVAAAAEVASGALLLSPSRRARRLGGAMATVTMVGVFPANVNMALQAGPPTGAYAIGTWLRLPVQIPLIAWAWKHARGPQARAAS